MVVLCFLTMLRSQYMRKRKRGGDIMGVYRAPAKKRRTTKRAFVPGVDRTGGFYGRFAGRDGELKFHDVTLSDAVIATGGNITETINIIVQGTAENERIGRKCTIKSINWKYRLNLPESDAQSTPASSDTIRVILYLDKQANGAAASITDILETNAFQSFRNLANSSRFTMLLDKTITMNAPTLASDGDGLVSSSTFFKDGTFYKACNIPIEFNSVNGAMVEIRSNNLGVMLMGSNGICGFSSQIRLRYSDGS